MKKIKHFVQVGEALGRKPNPYKENFRRAYNAKHCECQRYEAEKERRNQELSEAVFNLLRKGIIKND